MLDLHPGTSVRDTFPRRFTVRSVIVCSILARSGQGVCEGIETRDELLGGTSPFGDFGLGGGLGDAGEEGGVFGKPLSPLGGGFVEFVGGFVGGEGGGGGGFAGGFGAGWKGGLGDGLDCLGWKGVCRGRTIVVSTRFRDGSV